MPFRGRSFAVSASGWPGGGEPVVGLTRPARYSRIAKFDPASAEKPLAAIIVFFSAKPPRRCEKKAVVRGAISVFVA